MSTEKRWIVFYYLVFYLPKTDNQWAIANNFLTSIVVNGDLGSDIIDLNAVAKLVNDSIYNYVKETYGTVKTHICKELVVQYKEH